ncbi:hypothetical protein GCM10023189_14700 [Nibrella saemangeumensis]|uniref:Outer membrane protein beta-barrel domain-containing protein n=2 Tax=Nibrella saemangeumensis TaxID=1084526 RepID=A0ABP8MMU9_9BACT
MPALLALLSTVSFAQTTNSTRPANERPVINERTKQDVREGVNKVEQNAKEAAGDVKEGVSNAAQEVKEETKEAVRDVKQGASNAAQDIKEGTRNTVQDVKQATSTATEEVKEEVKEATQDVKEGTRNTVQDVKDATRNTVQDVKEGVSNATEEVKETAQEVSQDVKQEVRELRRNELSWFQPGSFFAGASLGFGLGRGSGTYLNFHPRIGYFFLPGVMAGLRYGFENRLSTSYRANQVGGFIRYYPLKGRISAFGGVGYNVGREYASNISDSDRARFNSINLELGAMVRLLPNLGGEISIENNYYDRVNALAGRNLGGRIRFGFNYYFGRANP